MLFLRLLGFGAAGRFLHNCFANRRQISVTVAFKAVQSGFHEADFGSLHFACRDQKIVQRIPVLFIQPDRENETIRHDDATIDRPDSPSALTDPRSRQSKGDGASVDGQHIGTGLEMRDRTGLS